MSSLRSIPLHQPVFISDLTKIDDRLRRRMIALGFYEGCSIQIKRQALLSGPLTIEQMEYRQMIAIRRCDAEQIGVIIP